MPSSKRRQGRIAVRSLGHSTRVARSHLLGAIGRANDREARAEVSPEPEISSAVDDSQKGPATVGALLLSHKGATTERSGSLPLPDNCGSPSGAGSHDCFSRLTVARRTSAMATERDSIAGPC